MKRREFTRDTRAEIVRRATTDTGITCETCGATGLKPKQFHVDHSLADGLVLVKKKLTARDGTVMCRACHKAKTDLDVAAISKAKSVEAKRMGIAAGPKKKIESRGFAPSAGQKEPSKKSSLPPRPMFRSVLWAPGSNRDGD